MSYSEPVVELSDTRIVGLLCEKSGITKESIRIRVRARDGDSSEKLLKEHKASWPAHIQNPEKDLQSFNLPGHLLVQLGLLNTELLDALRAKHPQVKFKFNLHRLTGLGYYQGPCFHLKLKNKAGKKFMLADGGFVNWTQQLLNDKKERLLTSAIGIELMARQFI